MSDPTDTILDEDEQPHIDWGLWRQILIFGRPYKRHFLGLGFLALLTAACELLLIWLPVELIDRVVEKTSSVDPILLAYAIVAYLFCSIICGFILIAGRIATCVQYDIRAAAFSHLQTLSFSYFDRRPVGWLMARLTSDCNGLSRIIGWALLDIVWGVTFMTGITVAMLILHWQLALIVLAIVPPLALVCRYFQIRLLITSRKIRRANSHCTAAYNEGITGVRTSKSLVREEQNLAEFQFKTREMYNHSVKNAIYAAVFLPAVIFLCDSGSALAIGSGAHFYLLGALSIGQLYFFYKCVAQLSNPVQELARTLSLTLGAQASAERIQGLLDTPPEIVDSPEADSAKHDDTIHNVEFQGVDFAYKGGDGTKVLEKFDLKIAPAQTIALVGPTGGGKSTIVNLMCRFYEPTAGSILINGVDYRRRKLHWLQSRLGIVLQSPFLFSGTIRENIRYGRLNATDEQVEQAARTVDAHTFIERLSDGYDAQVGEGGVMLSTGQKQLISLARAILADPQILVMDEATSSVDTEAERLIQSAVERVLAGRIAVVIAHRLSTIRSADRILYIDAGRVVESGTHEQLLADGGRYHALYTHQFTEDKTQQLLGV